MIKIIFILSLSFHAFCDVTKKDILSELMGIHGTNWQTLIKSDQDKLVIKETLRTVINNELNLASYGYDEYYSEDIRNNAISEYGHFVSIDESGNMSEADSQVLENVRRENSHNLSSHTSLALYQSLKNAGTPDSLDVLSHLLSETQDLATSYAIARSIKNHMNGVKRSTDKSLDSAYITPYKPHLNNNYQERKGDWGAAAQLATKSLEKSYQLIMKKSDDKNFQKDFSQINNSVKKLAQIQSTNHIRNIASNQSDLDTKNDNSSNKSEEIEGSREIAAEESTFTDKYSYYFLTVLFFLIAVIVNRKIFFS